jgi:hypothetical protein
MPWSPKWALIGPVMAKEKHKVRFACDVEVVFAEIAAYYREFGDDPPETAAHLQELQDALEADAQAREAWMARAAWFAVSEWLSKDLPEGLLDGHRRALVKILRPLADRLSPAAQEYFSRALVHHSWLSHHPDGVAFVGSTQANVVGSPEGAAKESEPTEEDYAMASLYMSGELPEPKGKRGKK